MSRRRRGVALVQALVVVAALSALATALLLRAHHGVERLEARQHTAQIGEMLRAARALALAPLGQGAARPTLAGGGWSGARERPLGTGGIGWQLEDLQGRFNLGWLGREDEGGEAARAAFERLGRGAGLSSGLRQRILRAHAPDAITRAGAFQGPEAPALPLLLPARLLALATPEERPRLAALLPLLAALPPELGFNPNTAAAPVLAALWPGLDEADWRAFAAARDEGLFASEAGFELWLDGRRDSPGAGPPALETGSQWFLVTLRAWLDSAELRRSAVVTTDPAALPEAAQAPGARPGAALVLLEWPEVEWVAIE